VEEPTRPELERFFYLDDVDRELIGKRRGDHNRLGFALQMCTVRYLGLFLEDPLDVPWPVVEYLAEHLGVEDASCVKRYTERLKTAYEHAWEIRDAYGYYQFEDHEWGRKFRTFLHGRAWTAAEGPMALFNQAVGWLRRNRVLLPGVSVLARQVAEVRGTAEQRLYTTVAKAARRADAALPADLVALLDVPEGRRVSELERLRRPPTRTTGRSMAKALERVDEIAAFRLGRVRIEKVPPNRLASLARTGLGSKAPNLERTPEPKRTALLTSVVRHLEASAIDDALDLFALLMQVKLISAARRATDREWVAGRQRVVKAFHMVDGVFRLWSEQLDLIAESGTAFDLGAMWRALETEIGPRAEIEAASKLAAEMIGPGDDEAEAEMRRLLATRYNTVRPFLPLLGESPALGAASAGKRILEAVRRLPALARRKVKVKPLLPREIDAKLVPPAWRSAVYSKPGATRGGGGPRRVRGVRAGAAVQGAELPECVRLSVEPVGRPAGEAAGGQAVGGRGRRRPARAEPGRAGRGASRGAGARFGRGLAADGGATGGGRAGREAELRGAAQRSAEVERGPARRGRRAEVLAVAAQDHRGDAPEDRPAGPAVRGRLVDRVPGRVRAPRGPAAPAWRT